MFIIRIIWKKWRGTRKTLTGKDPDVGKHWREKEKKTAEDEIVSSMQWTRIGQIPKDSGGQGGLVCMVYQRVRYDLITEQQQLERPLNITTMISCESLKTLTPLMILQWLIPFIPLHGFPSFISTPIFLAHFQIRVWINFVSFLRRFF